ncbi:MAG: hypothetical protein M1142_04930 [Patescibacteria group bacterium]|nr:hypothetical protein [Patescibacteria group bacterium]
MPGERLRNDKIPDGNLGVTRRESKPIGQQTLWERIVSGPADIAKMLEVDPKAPLPYSNSAEQRDWELQMIDVIANLGRS